MTFKEYSTAAKRTAHYPQDVALAYLTLGLCGEAGEIANKYKKTLRDDDSVLTETKIEQMLTEVGDVLWYCARICDELGTSLDEVAQANIVKLASRDERAVIAGSGDNR